MCHKMWHFYYINDKCVPQVPYLWHQCGAFSKPPQWGQNGGQKSNKGVKTKINGEKTMNFWKKQEIFSQHFFEVMKVNRGQRLMRS